MMRRLFCAVAMLLLMACAAHGPNEQLKAAYDTTSAYVEVTRTSLLRGRITPEQAAQASTNAKRVKEAIDTAAIALRDCIGPCTEYVQIMQSLQPRLLELEAELRKREGEPK